MEEVMVTGIGLVTALGNSVDEVWDKVCKGMSGISEIENLDLQKCANVLGGQVKGEYSHKTSKRMVQFAVESIKKCLQDAGIEIENLKKGKNLFVIGTSFGCIFQEDAKIVPLEGFVEECLKVLELEIPYLTVSSACSSSSDALIIAYDFIKHAGYEKVICGGVDVLDLYKMMGHSALHTLSPTMCKPFSRDADGTLIGEGSCFFVLESKNTVRSNTKCYAKMIGACNTTDLQNLTAPSEDAKGPINCIKGALYNAGKTPEDVAYINAHGSGTVTNDQMEYGVYQEIFAPYKTPISATKGAFGHLLGATGALEAAIAILALKKKIAPPTTWCMQPKKEWEHTGLIYGNEPQNLEENKVTMSVTYGFGGANTCLVFADR